MKIRHKRLGDEKEVRDIADMPTPPQWAIGYIHGLRDEYIFYHGLDWEEVKPEPAWEDVTGECYWSEWSGRFVHRRADGTEWYVEGMEGYRFRKVKAHDKKYDTGMQSMYVEYDAFIIERRQS